MSRKMFLAHELIFDSALESPRKAVRSTNRRNGLVVDPALEAGRSPIDELDGASPNLLHPKNFRFRPDQDFANHR